jgi:hypothetical protein
MALSIFSQACYEELAMAFDMKPLGIDEGRLGSCRRAVHSSFGG